MQGTLDVWLDMARKKVKDKQKMPPLSGCESRFTYHGGSRNYRWSLEWPDPVTCSTCMDPITTGQCGVTGAGGSTQHVGCVSVETWRQWLGHPYGADSRYHGTLLARQTREGKKLLQKAGLL